MKVKILTALFAVSSITAVAQIPSQEKTIVLNSNEGVVTRGAQDPNIKQGMKPNDINKPAPVVKKKSNVERGGAPPVQLKAKQGNSGTIDTNITSDESLNDKNKPKKKIN